MRYYELWQKPVSAVTKISVGRSSDRTVIVRLWRGPLSSSVVAIATLAGIVPASFVLAHFGGELGSVDIDGIGWAGFGPRPCHKLATIAAKSIIFGNLTIAQAQESADRDWWSGWGMGHMMDQGHGPMMGRGYGPEPSYGHMMGRSYSNRVHPAQRGENRFACCKLVDPNIALCRFIACRPDNAALISANLKTEGHHGI